MYLSEKNEKLENVTFRSKWFNDQGMMTNQLGEFNVLNTNCLIIAFDFSQGQLNIVKIIETRNILLELSRAFESLDERSLL